MLTENLPATRYELLNVKCCLAGAAVHAAAAAAGAKFQIVPPALIGQSPTCCAICNAAPQALRSAQQQLDALHGELAATRARAAAGWCPEAGEFAALEARIADMERQQQEKEARWAALLQARGTMRVCSSDEHVGWLLISRIVKMYSACSIGQRGVAGQQCCSCFMSMESASISTAPPLMLLY